MSKLKDLFREQVKQDMNEWAEMVKSKVIDVTPLRHGDLRRSIFVEQARTNDLHVVIGSNGGIAPYNVKMHEIPFSHYTTEGTGWKYIERPFYENLPLLKKWRQL